MTIGVFDENGKIPAANLIVIEGKQDKGATVSAEISGLSKEASKVYGSNVPYYISQKAPAIFQQTSACLIYLMVQMTRFWDIKSTRQTDLAS